MGACLSAKNLNEQSSKILEQDPKEPVSQKLDPKDFVLSNIQNEKIVKLPGSIRGQAFAIEDCGGCQIYLHDFIDCITVDDCQDCQIFVGPVTGSIFIRNCSECKFIVACQQFRTRDCTDLDVLLYSMTKPIIETSKKMRFGCFQYNYPELTSNYTDSYQLYRNVGQLLSAKLLIYQNEWSNVYDFSQDPNSWSCLPPEEENPQKIFDKFPLDEENDLVSAIPYTYGKRRSKPYPQSRLVLLLPEHANKADKFCNYIHTQTYKNFIIVQIKQTLLKESEAVELFSQIDPSQREDLIKASTEGQVVGIEVCGSESNLESELWKAIKTFAEKNLEREEHIHVSQNDETARFEIHTFFVTTNKETI